MGCGARESRLNYRHKHKKQQIRNERNPKHQDLTSILQFKITLRPKTQNDRGSIHILLYKHSTQSSEKHKVWRADPVVSRAAAPNSKADLSKTTNMTCLTHIRLAVIYIYREREKHIECFRYVLHHITKQIVYFLISYIFTYTYYLLPIYYLFAKACDF